MVDSFDDGEVRQALSKLQINNVPKFSSFDDDKASLKEQSDNLDSSDSYKPKWGSSTVEEEETALEESPVVESLQSNDLFENVFGLNQVDEDDSFLMDDELPPFADEECREISRQIRLMEKKLEAFDKEANDHSERVVLMKDHLKNVNQEIFYTNGVVAAKKKEVDTEIHLSALAEREKIAVNKIIKSTKDFIQEYQDSIKKLQREKHIANDELDKLKLSLNWKQEELEQWATAAAKRESDNLALEKFRRADEVKIKELTLKLENVNKELVLRRAQVENERTDVQSKELEIQRMTSSFKNNHDDRRKLISQWQTTVETMRERDSEIEIISLKYRNATELLQNQNNAKSASRGQIEDIKTELADFEKELDSVHRIVQTRREERVKEESDLTSFHDELDLLKAESAATTLTLEKRKAETFLLVKDNEEKTEILEVLRTKVGTLHEQLVNEKKTVVSKEKITQHVEQRLQQKQKELKQAHTRYETLKEKMFQESKHLAKLRQKELNFINEIKSTQQSTKNMTSRLQQLEREKARQNEVLYNAEFKLQQMERKVARGLGVRSLDEKINLTKRIDELKEEESAAKDRKKVLDQKFKVLQNELKEWEKKMKQNDTSKISLTSTIKEIELEITSCEQSLAKTEIEKEENMVKFDLVRLEVRRLRDILNTLAMEVYRLEDVSQHISDSRRVKREELCVEMDIKVAQARIAEEERHNCAIEAGQRTLVAEKMKAKYEMITKAHNTGENGEEENSQLHNLIAAAQKRADLQQEGDRLDEEIRTKHNEIKSMEKTLKHLKQRNTNFRQSFTKIDKSSEEYQVLQSLESKLEEAERSLFQVKSNSHKKSRDHRQSSRKLKELRDVQAKLKEEIVQLNEKKGKVEVELESLKREEQNICNELREKSLLHKKQFYPHVPTKEAKWSIQELFFLRNVKEKHFGHILEMLKGICQDFPDTKIDIVSSLTNEGINL